MANIKESKCFTCSDNTHFTDRKDAHRHEYGLDIMKAFMEEGFVNSGDLKKMSLLLAKKFEKFAPIFTNIRRINSK